jgi:hypothetical protein
VVIELYRLLAVISFPQRVQETSTSPPPSPPPFYGHDASTTRAEVPKTKKKTSIRSSANSRTRIATTTTAAKRRKQSYSSRSKTPEFWDKLSRVPLCRRALREFNRQAIRPIAPQQRAKRDVKDSQVKQLQRFARRGGLDLRSIRGVSSVFAML